MVVLDACVLFPAALRDTLLRAAELELYELRWTHVILAEVVRNLVARGAATAERAQRLHGALQAAFPDAMVTGYEGLIASMRNHPKDRHVLAAAVHTGAQIIVTSNLRDFRAAALAPYGIEARSPDAFLTRLLQAHPAQMQKLLAEQAAALKKAPKTVEDVLGALARYAPRFVAQMRSSGLVRDRTA